MNDIHAYEVERDALKARVAALEAFVKMVIRHCSNRATEYATIEAEWLETRARAALAEHIEV